MPTLFTTVERFYSSDSAFTAALLLALGLLGIWSSLFASLAA